MFQKNILSALAVALILLPAFGQTKPNIPAAQVVKASAGGIDLPCLDVKPPKPMPKDDSPTVLKPAQWWVAGHDTPLVIRQSSTDGGAVIITMRPGPLKLPVDVAVGRSADKDDPEFVTITGKYVYCVRCQTAGTVSLEIVPALNRFEVLPDGKQGAQIPLTESDFYFRKVLCDTSVVPIPTPPAPVPPAPNPPPNPTPTPVPPPPAPVMGKLWGYILIEDRSNPFTNRGPVLQAMDTYVKANSLAFRKFDVKVETVPPDLVSYVAAYKKNPPPGGAMLYIIDSNGKSFEEGPPKATPADAVAQLTKYK